MMKFSLKKGFGFGLASGIITTLGLMTGLNSSTHSVDVVIGGILVIAIADAMSDALGMHISEEYAEGRTKKEIWEATLSTFMTKFIVALTFVVPVLLFPLQTAVVVCIAWGLSLIGVFSFYMAKRQNASPFHVIAEHMVIAVIVIVATHLIGDWVATWG